METRRKPVRYPVVAVISLALAVAGCGSTTVYPDKLVKLDGFRAGDEGKLRGPSDEAWFTKDSELTIALRSGEEIEATYDAIDVQDGVFHGVTSTGRAVTVPIRDVIGLEVSNFDLGDSVGRVVGGVVVVVVICVAVGIYLLYEYARVHNSPRTD